MRNLKQSALTIATIMILSAISGIVYHEIETSEEFIEEYVEYMVAENADLVFSSLYDDYDCPFPEQFPDEPASNISEMCLNLFSIGEQHNSGLLSMMKTMEDMDVKFGTSPEKDLLLYDRVILSNGNPEYIEDYNLWRDVHAHSLMLANYTSNHSSIEQQMMIINGTTDHLSSYCGVDVEGTYDSSNQELFAACESLAQEIKEYLSPAVQSVYADSPTSFLDHLESNENTSIEARLALDVLKASTFASMSFWSCEDDTPSLKDLNTRGALEWCSDIDTAREMVSSTDSDSSGTSNQSETEAEAEAEDDTEGRGGGDHTQTKLWKEMSFKERLKFVLDCIGLVGALILVICTVVAIIAAISATGGVAGSGIGPLLLKLYKIGIKTPKLIKSLFPKHDIDYYIAQMQEVCDDGIDNDDDGFTDCDDQDCFNDPVCVTPPPPPPTPTTEKLGTLSLAHTPNYVRTNGPQYWVDILTGPPGQQQIVPGVGYWMGCSYWYGQNNQAFSQSTYSSDRLIVDDSLVQRSFTLTAIAPQQNHHASISSGGVAEFYQEGQYIVTYVEAHPTAIDSPQTATRVVNVQHGCGEEIPNDTKGDVLEPSWFSALQTSPPLSDSEKWWEAGLRDLGDTMKDDAWMDERSCVDEDWFCISGTVATIHHNNMLGTMSDTQDELSLFSPIYSPTYISNLDATIVASNNSQMIDEYIKVRDSVVKEHEMFLEKLSTETYVDEHTSYAQLAVYLDLAKEQSLPQVDYEALKYVHDNWDESRAFKTYKIKLEEQIASEEFESYDSDSKLSLHTQLAVLIGSNESIMNGYCAPDGEGGDSRISSTGIDDCNTRGPGILKDVGSVMFGIGTLDPTYIRDGIKSMKGKKHATGTHPGFTSGFDCPMDEFESCVREQLEAVNYFAEARASSTANTAVCGEDLDLVVLTTELQKGTYMVGDPVEYNLIAECIFTGFEYKMKTEVISQSNNQVVYSDKIEPWVETDNTESFTILIQDGFDVGSYCVNSMLFERLSTTPVAISSGSDCFDVDPAKSDSGDADDDKDDSEEDSEEEDDGFLGLPGFSGFSALLAMLGAAIIAFRRLDDQ